MMPISINKVYNSDKDNVKLFLTIYFQLRYKYDPIFDTLNPIDGKISGTSAKGKDT